MPLQGGPQRIYPDGKSRSFAYENGAYPQALTTIFDEMTAASRPKLWT
jgi:hypothetical protein